jgi:hypothetical protein
MEWTCVSSPNGFYAKAAELRLRPVPEMGYCLVYQPATPQLHALNTTAWLVLELCDGADQETIACGYHAEVEPLIDLDEARRQVAAALDDLIALRLVVVSGVMQRSGRAQQRRDSET